MKQFQEREQGDEHCSFPRCRQSAGIFYRAGATALNRNKDIQLCDKHHEMLWVQLHKLPITKEGSDEPGGVAG